MGPRETSGQARGVNGGGCGYTGHSKQSDSTRRERVRGLLSFPFPLNLS